MGSGITGKSGAVWGVILTSVFFGVCQTSRSAEMRVWGRTKETYVQGTYNKSLLGGVQIRDSEGKGHLFRLEQLSRADLNYIQHHVPPEVEADVSYKTRAQAKTAWSRSDDNTELYTFTVEITKKSKLPYLGKLKAELFVLGRDRAVDDRDHCVLMDYIRHKFDLPEKKNESCAFSSREVPFHVFYAYWIDVQSASWRGKDYLGYVVSVSDADGNIVYTDADVPNVGWLTDNLPGSIEKLRTLYTEHSGSKESRHFRKDIQQTPPPRIPWFKRSGQT